MAESGGKVQKKREARSAVSNGTDLFLQTVDGRSKFPRRFRDLVEDISADMGGADSLTQAEFQLVRRAATLCLRAEIAEGFMAARGEGDPDVDVDEYLRVTTVLTRLFSTLGLRRPEPSNTIDLQSYLAANAAEAPPAA